MRLALILTSGIVYGWIYIELPWVDAFVLVDYSISLFKISIWLNRTNVLAVFLPFFVMFVGGVG